MMRIRYLAAIVVVVPLLWACGEPGEAMQAPPPPAELLLTNGVVYTVNDETPFAEAIAITNGNIIAVGTTQELDAFRGESTTVIDLAGRFAMPGINDGHSHPAWGGVVALYYCLFSAAAPPDEVITTIEKCVADTPSDDAWIQGGLWTPKFFEQFEISSPRDWLDAVSGDKAIALKDDSGHNYWVNSKALELLGIDETSVAPAGASYGRVAGSDRLNGLLIEAFSQVNNALPPWTEAHYREGVRFATKAANSFGVTGFKDASATEVELAAYLGNDRDGELTVHVAACLYGGAHDEASQLDLEKFKLLRDRFASEHVHTNFVKIFLDGVPTTARTAAMLAPYVPAHEGEDPVYGPLHVDPKRLQDAMVELDRAGFTVKIHTAGDRSVHEGLNAVEAARKANGASGLRHELGHAGYIDAADIPRFAKLNVVADLSPYLWFPSAIIEDIDSALGDRGARYWPNRQLLAAGAPMLAGSDWPSVTESLNPWVGVESLVTRAHPDGLYSGTFWEEEKLSVAQALKIFTLDGARALKLADRTGSVEVGKSADIVVLDRNPFEVPPTQLSETGVHLTLFEGKVVFQATNL